MIRIGANPIGWSNDKPEVGGHIPLEQYLTEALRAGFTGMSWARVFKALPGYSGRVVAEAEQDPEKAEPAKYARMGHDNVTRFLRKGGLI